MIVGRRPVLEVLSDVIVSFILYIRLLHHDLYHANLDERCISALEQVETAVLSLKDAGSYTRGQTKCLLSAQLFRGS